MRPAPMFVVAWSACVLSAASPALAQHDRMPYQVDDHSVFTRALCLDPCDCALAPIHGPLAGDFILVFEGVDPLFANFRVDQVRWSADMETVDLRIVGAGHYRIGGEFALLHQLTLDLVVGDLPPQHFDSGLILHSGRTFPYVDISIEAPQRGCQQDSIRLRSQPACLADFNMDGFLDYFDFDEFIHCFEGDRCPRFRTADFDGDGFVDMFDFELFVRQFEAGC